MKLGAQRWHFKLQIIPHFPSANTGGAEHSWFHHRSNERTQSVIVGVIRIIGIIPFALTARLLFDSFDYRFQFPFNTSSHHRANRFLLRLVELPALKRRTFVSVATRGTRSAVIKCALLPKAAIALSKIKCKTRPFAAST